MKKLIVLIPVGVLSVLITLLIAYLSLASNPFDIDKFPFFEGEDKIIHGIMYFGCACVYIFDYAKHKLPHHTSVNIELALTSTAIVYGLLMEVAQMVLTTDRAFDIWDWGADTLGAIIAFLLMHFFFLHVIRKSLYDTVTRRKRHKRHSRRQKHIENDQDY